MKTNKILGTLLVSAIALSGTLAQAAGTLKGEGTIQFNENTTVTKPVDPEEPGKEVEVDPGEVVVDPGPAGDLNIDLVSNFRFGSIADYKMSTASQVFYASPVTLTDPDDASIVQRGNYVQVTDKRAGTPAGWRLSAKQDKDFATTTGETLPGAVISLAKQNVMSNFSGTTPVAGADVPLIIGQPVEVLKADIGKGNGTTTVEFGKTANDDMKKGVSLTISAGTGIVANKVYSADVIWTLAAL